MESRREIAEGINFNMGTELLIETRMGADHGEVYALNPQDDEQVEWWMASLNQEVEVEASACGTSVTVGPTAMVTAGKALWRFISNMARIHKGEPVVGTVDFFSEFPPFCETQTYND